MFNVGEIKRGKEIDRNSHPNHPYIWVKCRTCGAERWVSKYVTQKPNYTGLCRKCLSKLNLSFINQTIKRGHESSAWKGGRVKTAEGYVLIKLQSDDPFYSMAMRGGYVFEHRLVIAKHLNRCLLPWEVVHHTNGIRQDNRLENLELVQSPYKHNILTNVSNYIRRLETENQMLRGICDIGKINRLKEKFKETSE